MKKIKSIVLLTIVVFTMVLSSCGSLANMSEEDAFNVGYGVGTLIRNSR